MAQPAYSRQQLQRAAAADEKKYGLGDWFLRQIGQESGWNPDARSSAGAQGIAQFMPATARSEGLANPFDPIASLDAAAKFDAQLVKQYGSPERALSAYNSGRPDAYKDPHFAGGQTYNYVRTILGGQQSQTPDPMNTLTRDAPAASLAAAAGGRAVPQPAAVDFRPQLASELAHAAGTPTNDLSGFYATLTKALQARAAAASQRTPTTAAPNPINGLGHNATPQPLPGGRVIGGDGEQPSFLTSLAQLAAYEHAPVQINSGYRSTAKQAQLYANRGSNPNPVAPPGHSLHEQGLAADGTVNGIPLGTLPPAVLARYGLYTVPGDPVHVQARR